MFWIIIGLLGFWGQSVSAEVLKDTVFNIGGELRSQLNDYPSLVSEDLKITEDETEYFSSFYGSAAKQEGQKGDMGNRILEYATKFAYPIKGGLKKEDLSGETYVTYQDSFKIRLADRQKKEISYVASFSAALAEVLHGFITQGERRRQLGEHMITWKRDEEQHVIKSPIENLREDVQNLNYILSRGTMTSIDALILAEAAQLASQSVHNLSAQGNSSFAPIRKIQEAD